jgi:hypothetical protein
VKLGEHLGRLRRSLDLPVARPLEDVLNVADVLSVVVDDQDSRVL